VRADCTTRNRQKAAALQHHVDHLEARIARLAAEQRPAAERPPIDGDEVMGRFGIGPGPEVGAGLQFPLELKRAEPGLDRAQTGARLDAWWAQNR